MQIARLLLDLALEPIAIGGEGIAFALQRGGLFLQLVVFAGEVVDLFARSKPPGSSAATARGAVSSGCSFSKRAKCWKSERMVNRYLEHLHADRGAMPQLLEIRRTRKRAE